VNLARRYGAVCDQPELVAACRAVVLWQYFSRLRRGPRATAAALVGEGDGPVVAVLVTAVRRDAARAAPPVFRARPWVPDRA